MINEIFKIIFLLLLSGSFLLILPWLNKVIYRNSYGRNLAANKKLYGKYASKFLVSSFFEGELFKNSFYFIIPLALLAIGIGHYPFTSDVWIDGSYYRTRFFGLEHDFIVIVAIVLLINVLEMMNLLSLERKETSNIVISKLLFNVLFIINATSLILYFRSTDMMNILQLQEGGTGDIFGSITILKNPLLFISTFFSLLIFINSFTDSLNLEKETSISYSSKRVIVENLKLFFSTQFVVFAFLGGYSLVILPESLLDNIPIVYNVSQLVSLFLKMLLVYISFNYFKNKVKEYSSVSFKNFYMQLIFVLTLLALVQEIAREGLYGII